MLPNSLEVIRVMAVKDQFAFYTDLFHETTISATSLLLLQGSRVLEPVTGLNEINYIVESYFVVSASFESDAKWPKRHGPCGNKNINIRISSPITLHMSVMPMTVQKQFRLDFFALSLKTSIIWN